MIAANDLARVASGRGRFDGAIPQPPAEVRGITTGL